MSFEEQQQRREQRTAFTFLLLVSGGMMAVALAVHVTALVGYGADALIPLLRIWHLFAPALLIAPPLAAHYRNRSRLYTSPLRCWPARARLCVLLLLVYGAASGITAGILLRGGLPVEERGLYWLGTSERVIRLITAEQYRRYQALLWQATSALAIGVYAAGALCAWQFRKEAGRGFREIRLWKWLD